MYRGKYSKFIVALVGVAVMGFTFALGADNPWVQVGVSLATALGVYQVPNVTAE